MSHVPLLAVHTWPFPSQDDSHQSDHGWSMSPTGDPESGTACGATTAEPKELEQINPRKPSSLEISLAPQSLRAPTGQPWDASSALGPCKTINSGNEQHGNVQRLVKLLLWRISHPLRASWEEAPDGSSGYLAACGSVRGHIPWEEKQIHLLSGWTREQQDPLMRSWAPARQGTCK